MIELGEVVQQITNMMLASLNINSLALGYHSENHQMSSLNYWKKELLSRIVILFPFQ